MITLLKPDWQRWHASKRYLALFMILLVLGTLAVSATAARPAADLTVAAASYGHTAKDPAPGSDLVREADLRWVRRNQSDLRGQALNGARLTGADLRGSDLRGTNLSGAALLGTHLRDANLAGAVLQRADLHYAVLIDADLRSADLRWANLRWTDLQNADLRGARLTYARLHRVYLRGAILPDGTRWVPGRDMDRFTDPGHPEYWDVERPN